MVTDKNKETKANFSDSHVYLNFQLTKKKGELLKVVRKAKSDRKLQKYGTDQNGNITIRVKAGAPWVHIKSVSELEKSLEMSAAVPPPGQR